MKKVKQKQKEDPLPSVPIRPLQILENRFTDLQGNTSMIRYSPQMVQWNVFCQTCLTDTIIEGEIFYKCPQCSLVSCEACLVWKDRKRRVSYPMKRKKRVTFYRVNHNACCPNPSCLYVFFDYMVEYYRS